MSMYALRASTANDMQRLTLLDQKLLWEHLKMRCRVDADREREEADLEDSSGIPIPPARRNFVNETLRQIIRESRDSVLGLYDFVEGEQAWLQLVKEHLYFALRECEDEGLRGGSARIWREYLYLLVTQGHIQADELLRGYRYEYVCSGVYPYRCKVLVGETVGITAGNLLHGDTEGVTLTRVREAARHGRYKVLGEHLPSSDEELRKVLVEALLLAGRVHEVTRLKGYLDQIRIHLKIPSYERSDSLVEILNVLLQRMTSSQNATGGETSLVTVVLGLIAAESWLELTASGLEGKRSPLMRLMDPELWNSNPIGGLLATSVALSEAVARICWRVSGGAIAGKGFPDHRFGEVPVHRLSLLLGLAPVCLAFDVPNRYEKVLPAEEGPFPDWQLGQLRYALGPKGLGVLSETQAADLEAKWFWSSSERKGPVLIQADPEEPAVIVEYNGSNWYASRILVAMAVSDWPRMFVLGSFETRVTVYSQQCRALNLVRALFEGGILWPKARLVVIGGGVAGLTAAIGAARLGAEVVVYEARSILSAQSQASHRFLHPHLYDWPDEKSGTLQAGLPVLDWTAGVASKVVEKMRDAVRDAEQEFGGRLRIIPDTSIQKFQRCGECINVTGDNISDFADCVIVAVGFGDENPKIPDITPGYWLPDNLEAQLGDESVKSRRVLVSGSGDGALTDLLRCALKWGDHGTFLKNLARNCRLDRAKENLLAIEQRARSSADANTSLNLYEEYQNVALDDSLVREVAELRRPGVTVTFNYRQPEVFRIDSALINRVAVLLLIKAQVIERRLDELQTVDRDGAVFRANFKESKSDEYDLVVCRHGTDLKYFEKKFDTLKDGIKDMGRRLARLDFTRHLDPTTHAFFRK